MRSILGLFAKPPFEALNEHASKVKKCTDILRECVQAYCEGDFEKAEDLALEVSRVEREADNVKNSIRNTMPKSIFMPVDRGDFLNYLKEQDKVADAAEEAARTMTLRRVNIPENIKKEILDLTAKACDVLDVVPKALESFNEVIQFSFAKKEEKVWEYINSLDLMEREADHAELHLRKMLFQYGEKVSHPEFYLLMKTAKLLGEIADHSENCGDRMRVMIAKQ